MSITRLVSPDGVPFWDRNGNGRMDPYEDPRLPVAERVDDLLGRLSVEEKAGLLFQTAVPLGPGGAVVDEPLGDFRTTTRTLIVEQRISHINLASGGAPHEIALWHNRIQRLAGDTPHGVPVTVSTDPRHSFQRTRGVAFAAAGFTQWPEPLGLAAVGDLDLVRRFADVVRREYVAVGIRAALHPQIDIASEPRWGRQLQTFGGDPERVGRFGRALVEGLQGDGGLGVHSVAATAKHFPGGGPQRDGEDPHFPYGREQDYPAGLFELHLAPFRDAIAAGTAAIMPYYGMPIGLERGGKAIEEVGFAFNRQVIQGILRDELGFDGVVVSDWGLVHPDADGDKELPARAWGMESATPHERVAKILDAGVDQLGGERCPDIVIDLIESGRITMERLDASVRRLLRVKFALGLFDDPSVDEDAVTGAVGRDEDAALALSAQARSVTVLRAERPMPLGRDLRVFAPGVDETALGARAVRVATPGEADIALLRIAAPFDYRDRLYFESSFHAGSLEFGSEIVDNIAAVAKVVPVVLDVLLERPAILSPLVPLATVLTATYGCSDEAWLSVLFGEVPPEGALPFEIPRDTAAVESSPVDLPGGTTDPLFPAGYGLRGAW